MEECSELRAIDTFRRRRAHQSAVNSEIRGETTESRLDLQTVAASAENGTSNNIRNALKHCATKPGCEVAVIFVLEDMKNADLRTGLARYNGLRGSSQWKEFKEIYVVDINGDMKHLPPAGND